jgi:serine/threonine protein kinase
VLPTDVVDWLAAVMSAASVLLLLSAVYAQDAQQIVDRLWLGSCEASHNQTFVESESIALIVTVAPAAECSQPLAGIVQYVRFDLLDDGSHALRPFLPLLQREIDAALAANRSVLLHCVQGISRSPAAAMAYLMLSRDWSLRTALGAVRDARPSVQPRFQLFDELLTLERDLFGHNSVRHDANYVPIVLAPPDAVMREPQPLLAAAPVDRPSTAMAVPMAESDLLAGSRVQTYLLYERLRSVVCADCVTTEATAPSVLQWWPRCTVRDAPPSIEAEGSTDVATFEQSTPFLLTDNVGHGSFGEVWRATDENHAPVVLKRMFAGNARRQSAQREVFFGRQFAGVPHIAQFVDSFATDDNELFLVFEDHGQSLHDLVFVAASARRDAGLVRVELSKFWRYLRLSPDGKRWLKSIVRQTALALASMHAAGTVHRDIKPGNILISFAKSNNDSMEPVVHVCDFGSAISDEASSLYSNGIGELQDLTLEYVAPELLRVPNSVSPAKPTSDVWSLAVVMLELLFGTPFVFAVSNRRAAIIQQRVTDEQERQRELFFAALQELRVHESASEFARVLQERDPLQVGMGADSEGVRLLQQMLVLDPDERITASQIAEHAWTQV